MKKINNLQEILDKHQKWFETIEGGERANLSVANLRLANLTCANLHNTILNTCEEIRKGIILKEEKQAIMMKTFIMKSAKP